MPEIAKASQLDTERAQSISLAQLQFTFALLSKIWIATHGPNPSLIDHAIETLKLQLFHVDHVYMRGQEDIRTVLEGLRGLEQPSEHLVKIMKRLARFMEDRATDQEPARTPFEYIQFALLPERYRRAMDIQQKVWARTWLLRCWLRTSHMMGHLRWLLPISIEPQHAQCGLPWGYPGSMNFPPAWESSPYVRCLIQNRNTCTLEPEIQADILGQFGFSDMPDHPTEEPYADRAPPLIANVGPQGYENNIHTVRHHEPEDDCSPEQASRSLDIGCTEESNSQFLRQLQHIRLGGPQQIFLQTVVFPLVYIPQGLEMTEPIENWDALALQEFHRSESQGLFSEFNSLEMHITLSRTWIRYLHAINAGSQLIREGRVTVVHLYAVSFRLALLQTMNERPPSEMRIEHNHDLPSVAEAEASQEEVLALRMRRQHQHNHNRIIVTRQRVRELQPIRETQSAMRQIQQLAARFQAIVRRQIAILWRERRRLTQPRNPSPPANSARPARRYHQFGHYVERRSPSPLSHGHQSTPLQLNYHREITYENRIRQHIHNDFPALVPNAQRPMIEEVDARENIDLFHRPGSPRYLIPPATPFNGPQFRQYRSRRYESERSSGEDV